MKGFGQLDRLRENGFKVRLGYLLRSVDVRVYAKERRKYLFKREEFFFSQLNIE